MNVQIGKLVYLTIIQIRDLLNIKMHIVGIVVDYKNGQNGNLNVLKMIHMGSL